MITPEPPELSARSGIRERGLSEHAALVGLNCELLEAMKAFRSRVKWSRSQWAQDDEFLQLLDLHRLTLACANELAADGFYRDAYNTVRTALEGYLLLRLISTCDKYEFTYIVRRSPGDRSLDEAVAKVEQRIRDSAGPELISLSRSSRDTLTAVRQGVPIVDSKGRPTGRTIPFYYGAWKQYRPEEHHLSGLEKYLQREWSIARSRATSERDPRHRDFYRKFFTFDGIVDKLLLNRILNKKTAARVKIHYNFLSGFSHTTHRAMQSIVNINFYSNAPLSLIYNHYHGELALLYVCHLAGMFLDLGLKYFRRWRLAVDDANSVTALVQRVEDEFGYLWFIFNRPHYLDRYNDANRLSDWAKKRFIRPEEVRESRVRYYEDPLNRLRELHWTTRELSTGNIYISPFPRDDALRHL